MDDVNLEVDEFDLEQLIVDGADARIPIEIDFPIYNDGELTVRKYGVMIKPLTALEANNAIKRGLNDGSTDVNLEIVKAGLCRKDGEPFNPGIVDKLPAGVINALTEKICEVSGIQQDKNANEELIREMMGF